MSLASIKDWFVNVDISHTDWRLRWPLIILPFLLLALLYSLFKANGLSAQQAQVSTELQALVQSGFSAGKTDAASENDGSFSLSSFRGGIDSLAKDARTLQQWLEQGRSTKAYVQHAQALAELAQSHGDNKAGLPDLSFWNGFSDVLSVLENAVIEGDIKTPEAQSMVDALRTQYAELRTTPITPSATPSATQSDDPVGQVAAVDAIQQDKLQVLNDAMVSSREQRVLITKLQNRALVLSALSTALFGLLLWGMWRSAKGRQHASVGKTRTEQGAILRLLDEISPLAQGDLRVKATVSEASTGAVADAFNFAVDELCRLVRAVTESADLVKSSVAQTRESADLLAKASSVQAREIHRSSNYLNVMSDTMAQLSAHAVESSRIAEVSVQQARTGNAAVQANVDSLLRVRDQAEMTTRLMQRLVETSSAINERVKDIEVVAKRTDLLALNATIRSSVQVSNGGSESVLQLSDDIAHLAETLGLATRDIANLSDLIQQDANITLKSMSKTVGELDDGHLTARQASNSLDEIDRVSNELNGLIGDIASKSLRQAGVVKQLSANMGVINNITRDSTLQLHDSAKALETLQSITAELRASVSDFKLPRQRNLASASNNGKLVGNDAGNSSVSNSSDASKTTRLNSKVARNKVTHA